MPRLKPNAAAALALCSLCLLFNQLKYPFSKRSASSNDASKSHAKAVRISSRAQQQAEAPAFLQTLGCANVSAAAPINSMHIIIGGYLGALGQEVGFGMEHNNYLFELGLPNVQLYFYRRIHPEIPLRKINGNCGMTAEERLLLPNRKNEGPAFLSHVLEVWDNNATPKVLVLVHGHGARAWHTSCEAIFGKTTFVYNKLAKHETPLPTLSLTSHAAGLTLGDSFKNSSFSPPYDKVGWPTLNGTKRIADHRQQHRRRLTSAGQVETNRMVIAKAETYKMCRNFARKYKLTVMSPPLSCCGSFIVPWSVISKFPLEFYKEWLHLTQLPDHQPYHLGRACWEYLVWSVFGEKADCRLLENITSSVEPKRLERCQDYDLYTKD